MNIKYFLILILLINNILCISQNSHTYKTGDFVFQIGVGDFENAIINSTNDIQELSFSHVGIIYIEKDSIYVLESVPDKGVLKSSYLDFFKNSSHIIVGRLKSEFKYTIPTAINLIFKLMGKSYDFAFLPNNDKYYCSELIQTTFIDSLGNFLFAPIPMSFKDAKTGQIIAFWTEYFEKLGIKIPEGELGSNPTNISQSDKIEIIFQEK
ncbi:MAG: hypothetical protein LBV69_10355 [Bacteroidales bacterium]|nr:hypothetical protein [Bacteroidales bacterium]